MLLTTILNQWCRFKEFVYAQARFARQHGQQTIEVQVRPRKGWIAPSSLDTPEPFRPLLFALCRRHPVVVTLAAPCVVEQLDVVEHVSSRFVSRSIDPSLVRISLFPVHSRRRTLSRNAAAAASTSWDRLAQKWPPSGVMKSSAPAIPRARSRALSAVR